MKVTEKELRELLQQQTARSTPRQTECLTEEQFMRAVTGDLSSEERRTVARHLIACIDCTEEYRALRSLEPLAEAMRAGVTPSAEADPVRPFLGAADSTICTRSDGLQAATSRAGRDGRRSFGSLVAALWQRLIWEPRTRRAAAFAVLVIVAASSVIIWQAIRTEELPASTRRARVSSGLSIDPPDRAMLGQPPQQLAWSAFEHAITYRVVLFDNQSTPIWESSRRRETSATIPESVRQQLLPNQHYYWRVIAEDAIDQHQSELFQFTLTANERR